MKTLIVLDNENFKDAIFNHITANDDSKKYSIHDLRISQLLLEHSPVPFDLVFYVTTEENFEINYQDYKTLSLLIDKSKIIVADLSPSSSTSILYPQLKVKNCPALNWKKFFEMVDSEVSYLFRQRKISL